MREIGNLFGTVVSANAVTKLNSIAIYYKHSKIMKHLLKTITLPRATVKT